VWQFENRRFEMQLGVPELLIVLVISAVIYFAVRLLRNTSQRQ
jgi:hypothetical protein